MKKPIKTFFMFILVLILVYAFSTPASAVLLGKNGFYYEFEDDKAVLKEYRGSNTEVIIPADVYSCEVSEIGSYAFLRNTSITNVFIPDSITKIGNGAFYGCTNLESVYIPETVTEIENSVFSKCTELTIICASDTAAELYAAENNIKYQIVGIPKTDGYSLPSPEDIVPMMGDVDGSGVVTTIDSLMVLRNSVSIESFDESQSIAADVDGDGLITVSDSLFILRYCVGYADEGVNIGNAIYTQS